MRNIVLNIPNIDQYLKLQKDTPKSLCPSKCPHCGKSGLWSHGHYGRKTVGTFGNHDLVSVFRFFCPCCHRTCSVLPECIPPHRRYLWDIQQIAVALVLTGKSLRAVAKVIAPSRHTVSRWMERLKERFRQYQDTLCQHFIELGGIGDFIGFWSTCFSKISLSQAMCFCNAAGVKVP